MRYSGIVSIVAFGLASFSTAAPVGPTAQGTGEAGDSAGPLGGVTGGLPAELTSLFPGGLPGGGKYSLYPTCSERVDG